MSFCFVRRAHILYVYEYMWFCVCTSVVCVCLSLHTSKAGIISECLPQLLSYCLYETGSFTLSGTLIRIGCLASASHGAARCCSCAEIQTCTVTFAFFWWILGIKLRSLSCMPRPLLKELPLQSNLLIFE